MTDDDNTRSERKFQAEKREMREERKRDVAERVEYKIAQLVDLLRQLAEFSPSCNLHGDVAVEIVLGLDGQRADDLLTHGRRCTVVRLGPVTAIGKPRDVAPLDPLDIAALRRFAGETILPDDVAAALAKVTGP